VHDAVRDQLDSQIVRHFGDLAEHPRGAGTGADPALRQQRTELLDQAWMRTAKLIRGAQLAWRKGIGDGHRLADAAGLRRDDEMAQLSRDRFRAAMRIPALEGLSPAPWSGAARRVLPSPSPQRTATAMWGPVLAWTALELLAESIDPEMPEQVALALFDRLRLREPFARAFANLGFEGEESWRAAARIKVVLLTEAELAKHARERARHKPVPTTQESSADNIDQQSSIPAAGVGRAEDSRNEAGHGLTHADSGRHESGHDFSRADSSHLSSTGRASAREAPSTGASQSQPGLPASLWSDPDVRWLTGAHESNGIWYIVREPYEELLWWMRMPSLLRLALESAPSRAAVDAMSRAVSDALAAAEAAGYRIDALVNPTPVPSHRDRQSSKLDSQSVEKEESATSEREE